MDPFFWKIFPVFGYWKQPVFDDESLKKALVTQVMNFISAVIIH
jgi:hypothetical protein